MIHDYKGVRYRDVRPGMMFYWCRPGSERIDHTLLVVATYPKPARAMHNCFYLIINRYGKTTHDVFDVDLDESITNGGWIYLAG